MIPSLYFINVKEDRNIVPVAMLCILKMMSMLTVIKREWSVPILGMKTTPKTKKGGIQGETP